MREAGCRGGELGGMLAAAMLIEQAVNFCRLSQYTGYLTVAAVNRSSLITLSGHNTMVIQARAEVESGRIFVKRSQIDKAYHSDHMRPCAALYLRSLKHVRMATLELNGSCLAWCSVVFPGRCVESADPLSPVQFSSAVETAIDSLVATEVGSWTRKELRV